MKKSCLIIILSIFLMFGLAGNVFAVEIVGGYIYGSINQDDLISEGPFPYALELYDSIEEGFEEIPEEVEINKLAMSKLSEGNLYGNGFYIGVNTRKFNNLTLTYETLATKNFQEMYADLSFENEGFITAYEFKVDTKINSINAVINPQLNKYFSVSAGLGYYYGDTIFDGSYKEIENEVVMYDDNEYYNAEYKGTVGYNFGVFVEYPISQFTLNAGIDYRVLNMEVDTVYDKDGNDLEMEVDESYDLGGINAKIGLSLAF